MEENMGSKNKNGNTTQGKPSWPVVTAGVAAAGGAGLFLVGLVGAAPAAIAGAAGYLAYRGIKGPLAGGEANTNS
jgi:hypothetical protein